MIETKPAEMERQTEARLPRRDWILLPLLGLLTIVLLIAGAESTARARFSDTPRGLASCLVLNDLSTGVRGVPNSECRDKSAETGWTDYKFNSCGHRAGMECGAKDPGAYRIVMTGSSVAMGLYVDREESIAGRLPAELTRMTGRKVEVYNASIGAAYGGSPHSVALRMNEVMAQKPDLVLWVMTPWDLDHADDLRPQDEYLRAAGKSEPKKDAASYSSSPLRRIAAKIGADSLASSLYDDLKSFRLRTLVTHYLFESRSLYVKSYLKNKDDAAGFLKAEWAPEWNDRLKEFDGYAAEVIARAHAAGVPVVAVLVPNRAQAAMISMGEWPQGYDPYKIDEELRGNITSRGGIYADIFSGFCTMANPEDHYLPVDGHPDAEGHAIITNLLAQQLTNGAIPELRAQAMEQAQK